MNLSRLALVAIATARLTRFITTDHLGEWTVTGPLKRWAARREVPERLREPLEERLADEIERGLAVDNPPPQWGWRSKLVKGLDCPFCVGFWIGAAVLLGELIFSQRPHRKLGKYLLGRYFPSIWTFVLGALGLNYAVGHISSRID